MRIMFFLSMMIICFTAFGQTKSNQTKSKAKTGSQSQPAGKPLELKSALDSFSYAMGMSLGSFCNQQGINSLKTNLVLKGIGDASKKEGKPLLTADQMNFAINSYLSHTSSEKATAAKEEGRKFLAENAKKPGVVTLPSGLQYIVLKKGSDTTHPKLTDKIRAHYHGTLIDGTVFDSSVDRGEPIEIGVNEVIAGWTEALQLMTVGSKWKLFVPSDLGYGDRQAGPKIAPGSTLIFDLELLGVVKQ